MFHVLCALGVVGCVLLFAVDNRSLFVKCLLFAVLVDDCLCLLFVVCGLLVLCCMVFLVMF